METFSFLYYTTDDREEGSDRAKKIKARNIDSACKKFLRWKKSIKRWEICVVDYEVEVIGGKYIDISDQSGFENLI